MLDGESERRQGDDSLDPLQAPSTTRFGPISPTIEHTAFPDSSHFVPVSGQDFLAGGRSVYFNGSDRSVLHSSDLNIRDLEGRDPRGQMLRTIAGM